MIHSLEDFKVYNLAMKLGEEVWKVVEGWNYFQKDTIEKQLVRACDSIAANLSEGLGRYHFKEIKNFSYYSRGSLFEIKTWIVKSRNRGLISEEQFDRIIVDLETIGKMLNSYINSIGGVNEPEVSYETTEPESSNASVPTSKF